MKYFRADLHVHSRFSRATSGRLNIRNLAAWSMIKGLSVMSTGDFTHPAWRDELRRDLVYDDNSGLYRVREKTPLETEIPGFSRPEGVSEPQFLIQAEISSIYKKDGSVRNRHTAQGYAHESAWSRGQAWGIYGLTLCYRETGDRKYLDQALKAVRFMFNHKNTPEDLVFYWDMDAPNIPNDYRDASAAACIASALYEISTVDVPEPQTYKAYADRIMESLASPTYRAELGTNGNFLLMHCVGSIPHNGEIDVPLNYADYYFLEALKRKRDIEQM